MCMLFDLPANGRHRWLTFAETIAACSIKATDSVKKKVRVPFSRSLEIKS
jgi:hypothetical protein